VVQSAMFRARISLRGHVAALRVLPETQLEVVQADRGMDLWLVVEGAMRTWQSGCVALFDDLGQACANWASQLKIL
jgi:hypothetical protein